MLVRGAIFDWDGVIVDSSDLHLKSWEALASELKLPLPNDHFKKGFGKRNETIIPQILGWSKDPAQINHWGKRKEEIYRELGNKDGIKLARGSKDFLKQIPASTFRCSIGTSTERKNVQLAISQHDLSQYFLGDKALYAEGEYSFTRIPERVVAVLQRQVKHELGNSNLYKTLANYCEDVGYINSAKMFKKQSEEELGHYEIFAGYLIDKKVIKLPTVPCLQVAALLPT